ncbi:TPA: MW1434 family type I TA system toxin [Legionella anisa]|uniref:Thoeris anti-defense Tad2 family protein n=1 Tax=Legionella anisa TaxID=28082 RepID=UPI0022448C8E|nr:MW1434 family type I TA system toxin [Legionella anisa]MCW8425627.1 DUF2829 domain-containing protein [Legionella anisa]MCW8448944.1 DUF2829 domain-containing protein [Legionella anisa]
MLLQEALELLKAGEVVCREAWSEQDGYLTFLKGMSHIWKIMIHPAPNAGNYIFTFEDLTASDWKKFELPKSAIENSEELKEAA